MIEISNILGLIERLDKAKIHYSIESNRSDAISVYVTVPGERWEIDLLADGMVEIEIFKSDGEIFDGSKLTELFNKYSD